MSGSLSTASAASRDDLAFVASLSVSGLRSQPPSEPLTPVLSELRAKATGGPEPLNPTLVPPGGAVERTWSFSGDEARAFGRETRSTMVVPMGALTPVASDEYDQRAPDGIAPPRTPLHIKHLQAMARSSSPVFIALTSLRDTIFERTEDEGYKWEPVAQAECANCHKLYQVQPKEGEPCGCGCVKFFTPDEVELKGLRAFFDSCNSRGRSFLFLQKQCQLDVSALDEYWLIRKKSYLTDEDGFILDWKLEEVYRGDPAYLAFVVDEKTGYPGNKFVCIEGEHRPGPTNKIKAKKKPGRCEICKRLLYEARIVELRRDRQPRAYYIDGEFHHDSVFDPTETYGLSPLLPVYTLIRGLMNIERQMDRYYELGRVPQQLFLVPTDNIEGTRSMMEQIRQLAAEDKYYVPSWPYKPGPSGDWKPDKIDLDRPPAEMMMMDWMDMARRVITAIWGVTSIIASGDTGSSGMNNDDRALTVFKDRARQFSKVHNRAARVIADDLRAKWWKPSVQPTDIKDIAREVRIMTERAGAVQAWRLAGHDVKLDSEGNIIVSPDPVIGVKDTHELRAGKPNSRGVTGDVMDEESESRPKNLSASPAIAPEVVA